MLNERNIYNTNTNWITSTMTVARPALFVCSTEHTSIWWHHLVQILLYGLQAKLKSGTTGGAKSFSGGTTDHPGGATTLYRGTTNLHNGGGTIKGGGVTIVVSGATKILGGVTTKGGSTTVAPAPVAPLFNLACRLYNKVWTRWWHHILEWSVEQTTGVWCH